MKMKQQTKVIDQLLEKKTCFLKDWCCAVIRIEQSSNFKISVMNTDTVGKKPKNQSKYLAK